MAFQGGCYIRIPPRGYGVPGSVGRHTRGCQLPLCNFYNGRIGTYNGYPYISASYLHVSKQLPTYQARTRAQDMHPQTSTKRHRYEVK